ncbi:MAG: YfhO family protein, partial [Chloroflexi bacterium]|nr:YfhO family protein [Chloroflexota bacterium]
MPFQRDVTAVGILALSTAGFFWRVLLDKNVWVPAGGGDLASFLYPTYAFAANSLKQGILPLWNPYLYTGAPFAADIQSGLFYPINLIAFLLLPEISYQTMELLSIFHFFLAGAAMYFCLRFLKDGEDQVGRSGGLVGGIAYMFSDVFIVHLGNLNMIAVAAWLPLVFLFFHRGLVERSAAKSAVGGIALGIALLAGHIQPFLYTLLCLAIYFLFEVVLAWRDGKGLRRLLAQARIFAVFAAVALGVAAIQLLPSFELSQLSLRSDMDYPGSAQYSLSPAQLVSLFVPNFFGRGPGSYWGPWLRTEMGYLGVLPIVAALVAVVLRRRRVTYFLLALAAISLALSFGGYSVPQGWLYYLGAGFDKLRAPARFLFLFDFALAALAGLGTDRLIYFLDQNEKAALRRIARFLTFSTVAVTLGTLPPFLYLLMLTADKPSPTMMRLVWISEGIVLFVILLAGSVALL